MSEFFFDYKCISMGEKVEKKNDKALNFYLYQDYDDETNAMCAQINVPKEMQEKYALVKVYFSYNDVSFPSITDGKIEPEIWYSDNKSGKYHAESRFISTDNSIFIKSRNGELSGCGVLAFARYGAETEQPKIDDCYKFTINYSKKETISYRIVESKGRIRVQIVYPLIRKPIKLNVIQKAGAKPVLYSDRKNALKLLNRLDEDAEIVLKASGRVKDVFKGSFRVKDASKFDYRLSFADPSDGRYYLLVDESDYTMEDKAVRKTEIAVKNKVSENFAKCPFCGRAIVPYTNYKKGETVIVGCDGKIIGTNPKDSKLQGKLTIVCSASLVARSTPVGVNKGYIEANHLILPENYAEKPSMHLAVAGFPKSGKTIYLSSLFNMSDGGTERGIESYPFILNKIVNAYDKKRKKERTAEEVKFLNVDVENGFVISDVCERTRTSPREDIKKRYVMTVGGNVEGQTIKANAEKLSWNPIGYKMGDLGHMFFYDIPGEMFTRENNIKVRALDMADCLLAVINGANEILDPLGELLTTLERIPMLSKNLIDMKNIPIAIVFTKHDLKLTDYVDSEADKEFCFDENCHVVRENIVDMLPANGVYEGSALERHIDCSSYELEHYLKARDSGGKYARLKENYNNIKFFTCSALGNDACLGKPKGGTKEVLFRPRRLRVELPIIWLMYKKGLIGR